VENIKISIIEDEELVRNSLIGLIGTQPDFEMLDQANRVEKFLDIICTQHPDIILLDISLKGGMTGLEGIRLIKQKHPKAEIIMLTTFDDSDRIFKALCAGASAYLTKRTPFKKIVEAIYTVHRGGSYMSPSIARKVVEHFAPKKKPTAILTPRQQQIADGIVEGLSYKLIADKLLIKTETVRDHIKSIYRKLEINSKTQLIKKRMDGEI
jgi:DNA-binding NarL/FixJ family response regulator